MVAFVRALSLDFDDDDDEEEEDAVAESRARRDLNPEGELEETWRFERGILGIFECENVVLCRICKLEQRGDTTV